MAREDRDHSFEKALARHLRANEPARTAEPTPEPACADAEILAAYHERELAPEEMIFWKGHISSCSRCQQVLANLEATDAPLVDAAQQEKEKEEIALAGAQEKSAILQIAAPRRARRWLWTVPSGAIAAGLLVWLVLQQKPSQIDLAKNQHAVRSLPATPSPSTSEASHIQSIIPPSASSSTRKPSVEGDQEKANPSVRMRSGSFGAGLHRKKFADGKPRLVSPEPLKDQRDDKLDTLNEVSSPRESQAVGVVAGAISNLNGLNKQSAPSPAPAPPPPASVSQTVEVTNEAAAVRAQSTAPPVTQKEGSSKSKAPMSPPGALPAQQRVQVQEMDGMSRSRFDQSATVLLANNKSPVTVTTPNSKISWRVSRAGAIERTEDAGTNWSVQASGVVNDLLAGSAPSGTVCWIVGKLGTILRTADGGATWTKVPSPATEDITSVFAVNAQQATVFTAHASYQTLDGGATWNKLTTK